MVVVSVLITDSTLAFDEPVFELLKDTRGRLLGLPELVMLSCGLLVGLAMLYTNGHTCDCDGGFADV